MTTDDNFDFYIKQGDTVPALGRTLRDGDGNPINLNGATVKFNMMEVGATVLEVDKFATIDNPDEGHVVYEWDEEDTDNVGEFIAEFDVDYSGGTGSNFKGDETFPNNGYLDIKIDGDLR